MELRWLNLFRKFCFLFLLIIAISACTKKLEPVGEPISFDPYSSVLNYVIVEGQKLLTVEFILINQLNKEIGPFTMKVNITSSKLLNVVGNVDSVATLNSLLNKVMLTEHERHRYGFSLKVKNEITSAKLREIIDESKGVEIELIDESGKRIASQWIQTLQVVQ